MLYQQNDVQVRPLTPTTQPVHQPTIQATHQPTNQPTHQQTDQPIHQPTHQPAHQSSHPSIIQPTQATTRPIPQPTYQAIHQPIIQPDHQATNQPTHQATVRPSHQPTNHPRTSHQQSNHQPFDQPTHQPTTKPLYQITVQPSHQLTTQPIHQPSALPTAQPIHQRTNQSTHQPPNQQAHQPSVQSTPRPADIQQAYLAEFGLQRHRIVGDGNCLFRAISYGFFGTDEEHASLREMAVQEIIANPHEFDNHFLEPNENRQDELRRLQQDGQWAGEECIWALRRVLDIPIQVTYNNADNTVVSTDQYGDGPQKAVIHIIYRPGHYDAVVETETPKLSPLKILTPNVKTHPMAATTPNFHSYSTCPTNPPAPTTSGKTCETCNREFSSKQARQKHERTFHNGQNPKNLLQCAVPMCDIGFPTVEYYVSHLKKDHGANIITSEHLFTNMEDFVKFKDLEEKAANCRFVKHRGSETQARSTALTTKYICHRDGTQRIHLKKGETYKGTRAANRKGSCKIGGLCPSRFYVSVNEDNTVNVKYIETHSHSTSFDQTKFLHVPQHIRDEIAIKLSLKIPINHILDTIRSSFTSRNDRDAISKKIAFYELIDRKTILNIKHQMKNTTCELHQEDATSVYLHVKKLQAEDYNSVLIYKRSGILNDSYPALGKDDFMLAIMTKEQATAFTQFSKTIVCIDSTHKTNSYRYKLITVMVPDQNRRGYPTAFCISTTESAEAIELFFKSIKDKCPDAQVNTLMTDDDCAGIKAARAVFGEDVKRYLCIWHVHQSWRRKLRSVTNEATKTNIYGFLCAMLEAKTEDEYVQFRDQFISRYEHSQPDFFTYFRNTYLSRAEEWALCYRNNNHMDVNTNMFVESFHNKLKSVYFDKKSNRRVDRLLTTLLQIEMHMFISNLKNTLYNTNKPSNVNSVLNRHQSSLDIPDAYVHQVNENQFTVQSMSTPSIQYTINKICNKCTTPNCYQKCSNLPCINLCPHMYSCNCNDCIKNNLCKHVHKIHCILIRNSTLDNDNDDEPLDFVQIEDDQSPQRIDHTHITQSIRELWAEIDSQLEHPSIQQHRLQIIKQSLLTIKAANEGAMKLESDVVPSMPKKDFFAPGQKNILQPRFKVTKQIPGKKKKPRLTAPSEQEKAALIHTPASTPMATHLTTTSTLFSSCVTNPVPVHTPATTSTPGRLPNTFTASSATPISPTNPSQQVPGERR